MFRRSAVGADIQREHVEELPVIDQQHLSLIKHSAEMLYEMFTRTGDKRFAEVLRHYDS